MVHINEKSHAGLIIALCIARLVFKGNAKASLYILVSTADVSCTALYDCGFVDESKYPSSLICASIE